MFKLVEENREDNEYHNDCTPKMCPYVDCFIMNLEETLENLTVRIKVYSITCEQFVVSHVLWSLMKVPNVWF